MNQRRDRVVIETKYFYDGDIYSHPILTLEVSECRYDDNPVPRGTLEACWRETEWVRNEFNRLIRVLPHRIIYNSDYCTKMFTIARESLRLGRHPQSYRRLTNDELARYNAIINENEN